MKRYFILFGLLFFGGAVVLQAAVSRSRRFTPYFNMALSQGAYLPSQGDFFTGANIDTDVGLLSRITPKQALFSLYGLNFSGQGFRFQDTEEFDSKELGHHFDFEYRWELKKQFRLRSGIEYNINFTRTAAGEIWGDGLYDNTSVGGRLAWDTFVPLGRDQATITTQWLYRDSQFPNYTNIIEEFQGARSNVELAGGLKDQAIQEIAVSFAWKKLFSHLRYSWVRFKNETVVESTAEYGQTPQRDRNLTLSLGMESQFWVIEVIPELTWIRHVSNQNFLLYRSRTDPAPVFVAKYYNYNEVHFSVPVFVNVFKKWALFGGMDFKYRGYNHRSPRTSDNVFIPGKTQKNNWLNMKVGVRKRLNDVSEMVLTYSTVVATSNNEFERYLPYNYTGQGISISYKITY